MAYFEVALLAGLRHRLQRRRAPLFGFASAARDAGPGGILYNDICHAIFTYFADFRHICRARY